MTDMNPYPAAAEAVDSHLSKAIDKLDETTSQGFTRIEAQMRDMATKDAVNAHVARLDLRVDHAEKYMESGMQKLEKEMALGFADLRARDVERDDAAEKRDADRDKKFSRRMTWTISIFGLGWAITQFFITLSMP